MDEQKRIQLKKRLSDLEAILNKLDQAQSLEAKELILNGLSDVKRFKGLEKFPLEERLIVKSCLAIGQWPHGEWLGPSDKENLPYLKLVNDFFQSEGGILGYQRIILEILTDEHDTQGKHLLEAPGYDITKQDREVKEAIIEGIAAQERAAQLWPVGGAGDRLGLVDSKTEEPLPAALLAFCGYNLLEGLVRDLFAEEWLYYKLFGHQLITPIGLMTSLEKNNHDHINKLFEGSSFYGRPKNSVRCFMQPLVPVIDKEGNWQYDAAHHLKMKPGGHGVIWKLAIDQNILSWFRDSGRDSVIVRQINNPIGAIDYGVISLLGYGTSRKKRFGFLSCQRMVGAAEGMNVLIEQEIEEGYRYAISNAEYTEFSRYGIQDSPRSSGSPYSIYPSNTNILFASIDAIVEAAAKRPFPGPILNFKGDPPRARLETMMQNIADVITIESPRKLSPDSLQEALPSFILYGERRKTISVTKNPVNKQRTIRETALGVLFDYFEDMIELFSSCCSFVLPVMPSEKEFSVYGASVAIVINPALGPLWSIIGQKIRKGAIHRHSELILDIEALIMENLSLKGSMTVYAKEPLGSHGRDGHIVFSEKRGRARLKNVVVNNDILCRPLDEFLRRPIAKRGLVIILEGFSEIDIEDTQFDKEEEIVVPSGFKMTIREGKRELKALEEPTWQWTYSEINNTIALQLYENSLVRQEALS